MLKISFKSNNSNTFFLNPQTAMSHGLANDRSYLLHFGSYQEKITVFHTPLPPDEGVLTFKKAPMHLFDKIPLNIQVHENNIFLGPVMGVCVNHNHLSLVKNGESTKITTQLGFKDMLLSSQKLGLLLYYFSPKTFDYKTHSISGLILNPINHNWEYHQLPLPDIIYDRAYHQSTRQTKKRNKLLNLLVKKYNGQKINEKRIVSKQEFYEVLSTSPMLKKHLPETIISDNYQKIFTMLKKYSKIVTKPVVGYSGKNVLFISPGNKWKVRFVENLEVKTEVFHSNSTLINFLHNLYQEKKIIIQQHIDLLTYYNRPLDIRFCMQKRSDGAWSCTYKNARVAPENSPITFTPFDTTVYSLPYLLPQVLTLDNVQINALEQEILKVAHTCVDYLDHHLARFGELALDIGIDQNLNIWLFEANAMAWKGLKPPTIMATQHQRPLEYALFLTNKKKRDA